MHSKHLALFTAAALAAGGLFACRTVETTAAKALVSNDEENQLGQQVQQELQKQNTKFITDRQIVGYVTDVANKILGKAKKQRPEVNWTIEVIDDPKTVNAFAVPGGHLYVYSGLLLAIQNEAELAGVMGHESGHVALRHSARQMIDQLGLEAGASMVLGKNASSLSQGIASLAAQGTMLKFSRTDETEADEFGAAAMAEAGYDPQQLPAFFEVLQKEEGNVPGIMKYLSDHPLTKDRISHLHDYIAAHHLSGTTVNPQSVPPVQAKIKTTTGVAAPTSAPGPATTTAPSKPSQPSQPSTQPSAPQGGTGTYHAPPPPKH
jgi:predicted Zn-dependent protease